MPLQPGARLGPYEILEPLGSGGMGEVYRARDPRLARIVAVKVLPPAAAAHPERRARFEREARAASALNHPNIVTLHDVGTEADVAYLVMECVEGRTLRSLLEAGPLAVKRVCELGAQLADGLARAHSAGITHRDLKPENVMVTGDGILKILDFGLAKLAEPEAPDSQAATAPGLDHATRPGAVVGTATYMSPEQAGGRPVDFRTDQFALGLILYEMAAARHPFRRATTVETLTAILREEPEPLHALNPSLPIALRRVVERCLAKRPEERYASTLDLARDLRDLRDDVASGSTGVPPAETAASAPHPRSTPGRRWIVAGAALLLVVAGLFAWRAARPGPSVPAGSPSIAVLPFENLAGAAGEEYFVDGITEALITDLARVRGLLVIARDTSFRYKGRGVDVQTAGRELGVRYVLEGSAQRAGDTLRVSVQLIDAASGYHLWADRYDRATQDVFAVQDDISRHVVEALRLALRQGSDGARPSPPTVSLEAYDAYLRGLFHAQQFRWEERDKAIPWLEQAIALDPGFGLARVTLAGEYARKSFERDPRREWESKAFVEVERALAIDPEQADAYAVRGSLAWTLANHFPHERAVGDYKRALALNPNLVRARFGLGSVYLHVGLLDKASEQYRAALRLEPGEPDILMRIARIHLFRQEHEAALRILRSHPELARSWQVPLALDSLGRRNEAEAVLREAQATEGRVDAPDLASVQAILAARAGHESRAVERAKAAERDGGGSSHFHHAAYNIASAYALLGRRAEALAWLRRTADEGMPCYPLFEKDPNLDELRSDPAFQAFMAEMKAQWERFAASL